MIEASMLSSELWFDRIDYMSKKISYSLIVDFYQIFKAEF